MKKFIYLIILIRVLINSVFGYSISYLQLRPAAKFECIDDLPSQTNSKILFHSELDIIQHLAAEKSKDNQPSDKKDDKSKIEASRIFEEFG